MQCGVASLTEPNNIIGITIIVNPINMMPMYFMSRIAYITSFYAVEIGIHRTTF